MVLTYACWFTDASPLRPSCATYLCAAIFPARFALIFAFFTFDVLLTHAQQHYT